MRLERGLETLDEDEWTLEEVGVPSVEWVGVTRVEEDGVTCAEEYVESMNEPLHFMPGCPGIDWSLPIFSCS